MPAAERGLAEWLLSNVVVAGRLLDPDRAADPPRDTGLAGSDAAVRWLDDEGGAWC